jgi:putative membrane-bound dehydrogenase-like protein
MRVPPPEGWLSSFQIKKGFRLEIAASEALVSSPVAITFDENGRLFVAEMRDFPNQQDKTPHLGRIRLLEDTDGDGFFDSSTVYADNLAWPSAVACYNGGLYVASTPDVLFLKDVNGDGVADSRRIVFTGFGETNSASFQKLVNSFRWGLDNRIHGLTAGLESSVAAAGSAGERVALHAQDFSFDPRSLSLLPDSGPAQSGLAFDLYGRRLTSDYGAPLQLTMMEARYLQRNPFFAAPQPLVPVVSGAIAVFPFTEAVPRPSPRGPTVGRTPPPQPARAWMTQARGIVTYRGNVFPAAFANNVFISDPEAHLIHRVVLRENNGGLDLTATRAADEGDSEFLSSSDPNFRPVEAINGPDGVLYIADMGRGGDTGRILRIAPENFKQPKLPQLGKAKTYDLVVALAQGNAWQQETAARLLYERHDPACLTLLSNMIANSSVPLARLRALHALEGQAALSDAVVLRALRDTDEHVREHAVLLTENLAKQGVVSDEIWGQLRQLWNDPSPRVRFQLALTAGELRRPDKAGLLHDLLSANFANAWFQTAALSSLNEGAGDLFVTLAQNRAWRSDAAGREFLLRLATMIGARGRIEEVNQVLNFCDRAQIDNAQIFVILHALGEGLLRTGSSPALVDPQQHLRRFYDQTEDIILNESAADPLRIAALRLRSVSPYTISGSGEFLQLLFGSRQSTAVQYAALATLGRYENRNIPDNLFDRWQDLTAPLRTAALAALLGRSERVPAVLEALEARRIRPADFSTPQINLLRTFPDPAVAQRAVRVFGNFQVKRPDAFDSMRGALRLPGNPAQGQQIFVARCSGCHGFDRGPHPPNYYLAFAPTQRERLLHKIVEPNANLDSDEAVRVVLAKTGEVWAGALHNQTRESVTLELSNGTEVVLPRVNLAGIYPQPWSIMPEGLEAGLSPQQMADLIDFVTRPY